MELNLPLKGKTVIQGTTSDNILKDAKKGAMGRVVGKSMEAKYQLGDNLWKLFG